MEVKTRSRFEKTELTGLNYDFDSRKAPNDPTPVEPKVIKERP